MAAAAKRRVEILIGAALHPSFLKVFKAVDGAAKGVVTSLKSVNSALSRMERQGRKTEGVMRKLGVTISGNTRRMDRLGEVERTNARNRVKQMRTEVRAMEGLRQMQRNLAAATLRAERAQVSFNRARRDGGRIRTGTTTSGAPLGPTGNGASNARPVRPGDVHRNLGKGLMQAGGWASGAGIAAALPMGAAVVDYARIEGELQGVLNTAGVGETQRSGVMQALLDMTERRRTNKDANDLLSGLNVFASAGGLAFEDQMVATELSGRVATATRGLTDDMAKTGVALMKNLKVPSDQLEDVFGKLVVAGKMGAFELKDMAMYFPTVGAMAANLGMTGERGVASVAAAMQAVHKNTGTSGEAATNMENLLGKMMSSELLTNLKDEGIDWEAQVEDILADNKAGGTRNMLEEFVQVMKDATGGSPTKMKAILPDMQAGNALLALIQHQDGPDGYKATRDAAMRGGKADIDADFAKNTRTAEASMNALSNSFRRMKLSVGKALIPVLEGIGRIMDKVRQWADANPELTQGLTMVAAALAGIAVVIGPLLIGIGGMIWAWGQLAAVFGAGSALAGVAASVKGMFAAVAIAPMAALGPVLAVVAAIVAIGAVLYKFWEPLKAFFTGAFEGVWEAMKPVRDLLSEIGSIFGTIWDWLKELLKPVELASGEFNALAEAGRAIGKVIGFVVMGPLNLLSSGISMIGHVIKWLWNLMVSVLGQERVDVFAAAWSAFVEGVGKVFNWTWENVIKPLVDWLGGAIDAIFAKIDNAKKFLGGSESYDAARKKMVSAGAWVDEFGDDVLDMTKARQMVADGTLTTADIRVIQTDMYAGKTGEKLDQDYYDSLNVLMREAEAIAVKQEAAKAATVIENRPVTTINVTTPNATAAAQAIDKTLKERDDQLMRRLSDGAFDAPGGR